MDHSQLEEFCLSLKGTTTDIKWGNDLCYLIGGKMYCVAVLGNPLKVSIKVQPEEFSELTERDGIIPAPYTAKNHWIYIEKSNALSTKEWKHYVQQSYDFVMAKLPKKIKIDLNKSKK